MISRTHIRTWYQDYDELVEMPGGDWMAADEVASLLKDILPFLPDECKCSGVEDCEVCHLKKYIEATIEEVQS